MNKEEIGKVIEEAEEVIEGIRFEINPKGHRNLERLLTLVKDLEPKWQPIETAPRDGTFVILWIEHNPKLGHRPEDSRPVIGQWIDHNGGGWTWYGLSGIETHWMPLPEPPK